MHVCDFRLVVDKWLYSDNNNTKKPDNNAGGICGFLKLFKMFGNIT